MLEQLWLKWVQYPWHAWLKEEPKWLHLFLDVALKIPGTESVRFLQSVRPLVLLPPPSHGRVVRVHAQLMAGVNILQLNESLLTRPKAEAHGIIAHELAHIMFAPSGNVELDDMEADRIAAGWGFKEGLLQALEKDLGVNHPR